MRVLAIGENGTKEFAQETFPEARVESVSLRPRKMQTDYDALLSYMVLPRVPFHQVDSVVKSWVGALKQGGEIVIFAPSLEWAAYQVLSPERSPVLVMHLFGKQDNPTAFYTCGFTMLDLRALCAKHGIAVTHAQTGVYMLGEYECECHIVRGVKR